MVFRRKTNWTLACIAETQFERIALDLVNAQDCPVPFAEREGDVDLFWFLDRVNLEGAVKHAVGHSDLLSGAHHPNGTIPGKLVVGKGMRIPRQRFLGYALVAELHRADFPHPLKQF